MKYILRILTVMLGFGAISSCSDWFDINNDPTQIVSPDPSFTLTSGLVDVAYFNTDNYALAANY
ncbi:MAG: hypothetical protein O2887_14895 [Bacteroidetes bacterium]|nr:hypothetical protein [Bacteroidota bacterium]MDA1121753.1 hypothetical protein [Bacteroidota bacterium]